MNRLIRGARLYAWHLLLIGLIIGLLWAGIGFNLWHDHAMAEQAAIRDSANLARSFDENITRTVEGIDQALLFVRAAYQRRRTEFVTSSAPPPALLDDLHVQLSLADRDGRMIWSNLGPVRPDVSLADRPHFLAQKTSTDDRLLISRPVLGRVSGKWTIQFVRKPFAPDGSFDGIIVVSVDPGYLSRFYQSISIGNGAIILATVDGVILAQASGSMLPGHPPVGGDLTPDARSRLLRAAASGAYRTVSSIDQVERIFSARRLERYPLVVGVGLATDDVFAAYKRNKYLYLAVGIVLSVACIVVGLVILRQRQSVLESRQALSATLDHMSQGLAMVRADGTIPVLNYRAIDLLELPPELLASRPTFQQIVDWQTATLKFGEPETWDATTQSLIQRKDRPHGNYTYERTRPDGVVLEVRTQALPDGSFVRTFTDITERKHNEAALAAAQARAAHAERMQALGQLAGGIAHDFNNILQAVQGGVTLISKRADDPTSVQRFVRMVLDATERGTSITRRLLAFARRGELRAEPVDPVELLTGLRDVLSHTLGSGITVELELAADLTPLLADKGQLETALVNLATNARDAMPDGGTLTFAAALQTVEENASHGAELAPGLYVHLSIADTGSGMDRVTLARVLEPFFSTKPPGHGTGLGLSMAKGFAEQSGGGLTIDSAPGQGTTVDLWLPATERTDAPPEPARPVKIARDDAGKRILLVDDEAMIRETLAEALEDAGYSVLSASDGAEALDLIRSPMAIDILVTDLSMPGLDGLAVIRQAQHQRSGLPAVLLTGYAGYGAQLAVGGSLRGAFSLMHKPVTAAQLADRIEALLAVSLAG